MADSHHSTAFPASKYYPDRGPAKYFHGRRKELNDFSNLLQYASNKSWGTTFLVQGLPVWKKVPCFMNAGSMQELKYGRS